MLKRTLLILLSVVVLQACSSGSNETSNQIDYSTLDSLQTEVVMEIGETEDYLPGQLTSLVVTSNENILVADRASNTIEQFSADGRHRATVATGGKGPGEVSGFFVLRNGGSDTLIVNQLFSQRDYFVPDHNGIYQFYRSYKSGDISERSFRILGAHSDTSYYAEEPNLLTRSVMEDAEKNDYRQKPLVIINSSGKLLQDSVQMYKANNPLVERSGNTITMRSIPFRFDDALAVLPNSHYLIARMDSSAIFEYNSSHELVNEIPLNITSRPISSDDLDYVLGETEASTRNKIEARLSDQKPPFRDIYATEDYIWLHTNTSEAGKEMVVIDYDGNPIGKFMLPEVDSIQRIKGNAIYTIHESPELGHLIRKYKVDLS